MKGSRDFVAITLVVGAFSVVLATPSSELDLPDDVKLGDCWSKNFKTFAKKLENEASEVGGPMIERYKRCKQALSSELERTVSRFTESELQKAEDWNRLINHELEEDEPIVRLMANEVTDMAMKKRKSHRDRGQFEELYERVMDIVISPFEGTLFDQVELFELLLHCSVYSEDFTKMFDRLIEPDPLTRKWIPIAKLFKNLRDLPEDVLEDRVFEYLTVDRRKATKKVTPAKVPLYKMIKFFSWKKTKKSKNITIQTSR